MAEAVGRGPPARHGFGFAIRDVCVPNAVLEAGGGRAQFTTWRAAGRGAPFQYEAEVSPPAVAGEDDTAGGAGPSPPVPPDGSGQPPALMAWDVGSRASALGFERFG